MSELKHRVGVKEANLVVRNMKLYHVNDDNKRLMLDEIDHICGGDAVSFYQEKSTLHLAYDATHVNLDCIEVIIKKHGIKLDNNWWSQIKKEYYKFVDQNIKENAQHKPLSCHKVPPGNNKKR